MKVVILAGGLGTRLSEETVVRPKPMVEIGNRPILWHIMKIYAHYGLTDFIVCLGYKGYFIKEYFANYFLHNSDVTFDLANNKMDVHQHQAEPWRVTLVDTGDATQTGGRVKRVAKYIDGDELMLTYGDGVADIDVNELLAFHRREGKLATVTAVQQPSRWGALEIDGTRATGFREKPSDGGWINGGFFVLSKKTLDTIDSDETVWENEPMQGLASEGQLSAYQHRGFWQAMDTMRDRSQLDAMWTSGRAPWKVWP